MNEVTDYALNRANEILNIVDKYHNTDVVDNIDEMRAEIAKVIDRICGELY